MPTPLTRRRPADVRRDPPEADAQPAHLTLVPPPAKPALPATPDELRAAFGARLKAARERRGVSLASIGAATKVSASAFAALERGDVSRWPAGIYRRAFVRGYASAVGLPPDATVAEFLDLFADPAPAASGAPLPATQELRLLLDEGHQRPGRLSAGSGGVRDVLTDAAAPLLAAAAAAWWTGEGAVAAAGVLALCYLRPALELARRAVARGRTRSS